MSTLFLLLVGLFALILFLLWGFLAMASWSDRELTRAWQEAKADAGATAD
jgi:hypothetical protein